MRFRAIDPVTAPDFELAVDRGRKMLRIRLTGFFDPATLRRFALARREAFAALGEDGDRHHTLCDVTGFPLQSQATMAAFAAMLGEPERANRRFAFVVGGSLARMQVRRLLGPPLLACFDDAASAEAWLFAGERESRAA